MPVKHRKPGIDATELERWRYEYYKRNLSPEKSSLVPGATQIEYRKKVNYFSFLTMIVAACRKDSQFSPEKVLNDWWRFAFVKPFPPNGACLEELTERIRAKLWEDHHDEPVPSDPIMLQDKDYQGLLYCQINKLQPEEVSMTIKTKTKTKTKTTKAKPSSTKSKSADVKKGTAEKKKKEPKERSLDNSAKSRLMCVDLLMEQKYTDEEIVQKITDELDYPYSVKRVDRIRQGINEGKREKKGIPAPNPPLEPITKGAAKKTTGTKSKTKPSTKAKRSKAKK